MEHLRQSILEAESKTGRRLTELRREFNKLAAGKLSEKNYKFLGSFKDKEKEGRTMKEPSSTDRDKRKGIKRDYGYGYDVDTCRKACKKDNQKRKTQKKYKYFALQDGGNCRCSANEEYNKHGRWTKKKNDTRIITNIEDADFCWKSQQKLKTDDTRNYYGARNDAGKFIGLNAKPPTRVQPGEGGSGWCNSVYSMVPTSGPTLTDVKKRCYKAKRGGFGTTIKNITPEECAEMFPNAKELAIHAVGDEFGRFECSTINKNFGKDDIHESYPLQTTKFTEVPGFEEAQFYDGRMCVDKDIDDGAQYNTPAKVRSERAYRILKVNRATPKKKSKKSKKKGPMGTRSRAHKTRAGKIYGS